VPISIAFVALGEKPKLSAAAIQRDLKATWPSLPEIGPAEENDNTLAFSVGETQVICGLMPAPIPWSDLQGPCATSWLWKEAASVLKQHKNHLIVTVMGDENPLNRIKLLSMTTASILATCPQAMGVYWGEATLVVSPELFRDFATQMLPEGLPLYIWIDFRVGRNESGGCSGFTTGLKALGHMELETLNSPEPPGELRERLFGLACYLIENGPVIRDGDTVGEDANERIQVGYSPSSFGQEGPVMRLNYSSTSAAPKPWWKFW
jgi:hypothetical protein